MRKIFILLLLLNAYLANAQVEMRTDSAIIKSKLRIKNHSEGLGKVLTSDALGNASWQNPSGGGGLWTQNLGLLRIPIPMAFGRDTHPHCRLVQITPLIHQLHLQQEMEPEWLGYLPEVHSKEVLLIWPTAQLDLFLIVLVFLVFVMV